MRPGNKRALLAEVHWSSQGVQFFLGLLKTACCNNFHGKKLKLFKLLFLTILLVSLLSYPQLFWSLRSDIASGYGDFVIFYTGAEIIKAGMGKRLYNYETQKAFQEKLVEVPIQVGPMPFNHPPFELLVFLPLSYLPYPLAHLTWSTINIVLLVAIFLVFNRFIQHDSKVILCFMLLAFFPVFLTMVRGQDSILATFVFSMTFACLKNHREMLAGSFLALGMFKPQLVFPAVFILLFKRRWAALIGFLIVSIFLGIVSLKMVTWHGLMQYVPFLGEINRQHYSIYPERMPNVRGFSETVLVGQSEALVWSTILLISISLVILLLYLWRGNYQPQEPLFDLKFSLTMVVTVLTSYHLNSHDLSLLVIPAILTLNHFLSGRGQIHINYPIFLCLLALISLPQTYILLYSYHYLWWLFWIISGSAIVLAIEISYANRFQPQTRC